MEKIFLAGASDKTLADFCAGCSVAPFRARQIAEWLYGKLVVDPGKMSNLPSALREKIGAFFYAPASRVAEKVSAPDGVSKFRIELFDGESSENFDAELGNAIRRIELFDGESVETVSIPTPERRTFCLSTQVGCPVGCRFCASGARGLTRNLRAGEILEEFLLTARETGCRPDNLVFMGIGEGLVNYDAFVEALDVLVSPDGFGFSPRRITVSTSGFVPGMRKFAGLKKEFNLAVSLHAVDDETRAKLIPDALRYPIREVLEAADFYRDCAGRQYTIEYTLIAGVNDSVETARKLAKLAIAHRAKINLIPLNQAEGDFRRPDRKTIEAFEKEVAASGARVTRRVERGFKRGAACGQLRSESLRKDFGR